MCHASNLGEEGFIESSHGVARTVPYPDNNPVAPVTHYEMISVDTIERGKVIGLQAWYRRRLAINVFGETGMDNIRVQIDGAVEIQLPIVERVVASGLTLSELQTFLNFQGNYLVASWRQPGKQALDIFDIVLNLGPALCWISIDLIVIGRLSVQPERS